MFRTIKEIKQANRASGGHWFDPDTLRFFRSRIDSTVYGGRYFVSSEQYDDSTPRLYTVREAKPDGDVETVGEFQAYATRGEAISAISRLLTEEEVGMSAKDWNRRIAEATCPYGLR